MNRTFGLIAALLSTSLFIALGCNEDIERKTGGSPFTIGEDDMGSTKEDTGQVPSNNDFTRDLGSPNIDDKDASTIEMGEPDTPTTPVDPPDQLGETRPAPYYVPDNYDPDNPVPVLVVLHGFTGNGSGTVQWWNMRDAANEAGVMLIVPDGKKDPDGNPFWNATDFCCDFYRSGVDDVGYITGLIEEAGRYFSIDAKRVYLMGHSNGGFMSHRIACDRSDLVAAIVNVAGATWYDAAKCGDPEPVSVLQVHGTWDTVIYYDGVERNAGGPNVPPIDSDACLTSECGGNFDACLNNMGCNNMVGCFGQCEANGADSQCYQNCFDDGAPTAQFLWMETWTCGLNAGCYADPTQPTPGYASAKEGAARWAAINGCRDVIEEGSPLDLINDPEDDTFPSEYVCSDGLAADLWTIRYGSHGPNFHRDWAPQVLEWLLNQKKP